jgi:hypothetical protein
MFEASIDLYNRLIAEALAATRCRNVVLADVFAALRSLNDIGSLIDAKDGHHITAKAHGIYASTIESALGPYLIDRNECRLP